MKNLRILIVFILCAIATFSFAQKKSKNVYTASGENAIYKNEWSLGARFHTNGFSTFYERVWVKDIWKKKVLQFDFFYYKDFRETKRDVSPTVESPNGTYIYGKQNNFFQFKLSYGKRKIIANKMEKNGVRFSYVYMGGVSLGILKPYHLEFENENDGPNGETIVAAYGEIDDLQFLDLDPQNSTTLGYAGLRYGFNKIKPLPSIHGKFGFNFDWANKEYFVKSLEIGAQLDIFYKKIPIMISDRNKPYILNFYLSMQMGKRW